MEGVFCICGNAENLEMGLKVDENRCSSPCPENSTIMCGGWGAISVFDTGMGSKIIAM